MKLPALHRVLPEMWVWLLIAVLLGAARAASAAPACPNPITFAFFESGLMYSANSNDGIDKAVLDELARRSQCRFEFSVKPRPRIWLEMERGDLMMTGSAIRTAERDTFAWAVNYFALKAELMVRNANGVAIKSKEEFLRDDNLKMGVSRGFTHGDAMGSFIDELRQRNRVVDISTNNMYDMLTRNRFAAMPVHPLDSVYRDKHDVSQFNIASDWFPTDKSEPRALLFSKKHFTRAQVQKWRVLLQQMRDDGTLKKIYTQYAGKDTAEKLLQFAPDPL